MTVIVGAASGLIASALWASLRHGPKTLKAARRRLAGTRMSVVGPAHAGKTTFYNYLRYGSFAEELPALETTRVGKPLSFDIERGGEIKLQIRSARDIPGEYTPKEQVQEIQRANPDAVIVFLALDHPEHTDWLRALLRELDSALRADWSLTQKLRSLLIVLNKSDLVATPDITSVAATVSDVARSELSQTLGTNLKRIEVIPCTLKTRKHGAAAAGTVVLRLIRSLRDRSTLKPGG